MADRPSIPKMKLWYYPRFRSTRCIWLIKELEIEENVEYKYVDMGIGPTGRSPEWEEYRKSIHPHGTVPALEIEGHPPMLESGAICIYLASLCGSCIPEAKDSSEYYNWISYCTSTLDGALSTLFRQWRMTAEAQRDEAVIKRAKESADVCLETLDKALQGRKYILGDTFTAADCVVGYNVLWASELNKDLLLKNCPNLLRYRDIIMARSALQQALAVKP